MTNAVCVPCAQSRLPHVGTTVLTVMPALAQALGAVNLDTVPPSVPTPGACKVQASGRTATSTRPGATGRGGRSDNGPSCTAGGMNARGRLRGKVRRAKHGGLQ